MVSRLNSRSVAVEAVIDVLSHWCYVALPAIERLAQDERVELSVKFAPINNGEPLRFSVEWEKWHYRRGTNVYGEVLRSDWFEGPATTTYAINAACLAASTMGSPLVRLLRETMDAVYKGGALAGREDVAVSLVASIAGVPIDALRSRMSDHSVTTQLVENNRRLSALGATERPAFAATSNIGDSLVLRGIWKPDAILAPIGTMLEDADVYAQIGPCPHHEESI